ncbi:MAG: ATP-binding cassette domain-containing protein [Spirochaetes bacterium]|nr:MAG: ATP-binding cassette domain-containing protein [Spirochaetota bacterium]
MISVNGVTKYYGSFCAVNDISFSIRKGEITGLLGPNGAGKTTTLRMLTCYLKPTSGRIALGDYLVDENPRAVKRMIGYLPESAPLYADMLVYDYLEYVRRIHKIEDPARVSEIARTCGITEVMHKNISELSKGYRQRVGLAHAMIHDPEILVLDEPTSGLDPNQIIEIRTLIREIGKKKTVILSTHILSEVEATCDRVIIIDRGSIVADSRMADITSSHNKKARILVRVKGAAYDELSSALGALPGAGAVNRAEDPDGLTAAIVTSSSSDDIRPAAFAAVRDRGWTLYELSREHETLEHVFRQLTKGGLQ